MLANAPDFVYFKDRERRFVCASRPFEALLGRSQSEILGKRDEDLFPPEVASQTLEDDRRVIEEGMALVNKLEGAEDPDGKMVWVLTSKIPWRDADGRVLGLFGISRNVTDRVEAEDMLRVERERLARFMDSATDSFHLLDSKLRVIEINETAMARIREVESPVRSKDDVIGRSLLDVYPFLRGGSDEARFREVLSTGEPLTYDSSAVHPLRGKVHMTVKLFKVGDDLGLIGTDISDRKRAEEERLNLERQVQHSQKLESLGVLAGGIAHDFNNILVSILGHADLALNEMPAGAAGRNHVDEIIVGARRAKDLTTQMLAYSGKGRFELRPIDLSEFVKEMVDLLQVSTSKKALLQYHFAEDLPAIRGDTTQVRQVIMNLITNASEAIGDRNGVITVTTGVTRRDCARPRDSQSAEHEAEREYVYLEVTDNGCGMDEDTRHKMFEPFYTTKFAGRGLGMAAVQGILRGHEGFIEVRSQVDEGTTVKVLFPAAIEQAVVTGSSSADVTGEELWQGTGSVLVVDDEESVRGLARQVLELLGFQVLEAGDGKNAIEIFRENLESIRLVILDLTMPKMGGEECFRALRELKSDVPVILSSGYSEQETSDRVAGLGIRGFIQKPYRMATMRSKVRQALAD
jgi:PAS domain S-box-containing protein